MICVGEAIEQCEKERGWTRENTTRTKNSQGGVSKKTESQQVTSLPSPFTLHTLHTSPFTLHKVHPSPLTLHTSH
jgi:hypothetical protein